MSRCSIQWAWPAVRSVDLDPSSLVGQRPDVAIAVYTTISPRISIRLVVQSRYGVQKPSVAEVGEIIARLRELQASD